MSDVDGGPAFPVMPNPVLDKEGMLIGSDFSMKGMSLRDHFAGLAMQAIISKNKVGLRLQGESVADQKQVSQATAHGAYFYADAMLKERKNE